MLSVEEIKKGCEFAEGFTINDDCIIEPVTVGLYESDLQDRFFREIIYPLFLQRVIEGINKTNISINQQSHFIYIYCSNPNFDEYFYYHDYSDNIDQAKEALIKYILDKQERIK